MRALRYHGREDVRLEDVDVPNPAEGQVLVEVEWCGICGSDLHEYLHGPKSIPTPERPNALTGDVLPITMGHEICGRVVTVPEGSALKKGQAVMVDPRLFCNSCHSCQNSSTNSCRKFGFLGLTGGGGGGLSEYVAVDNDQVYPVPESTLHVAALIEPLCVAWHGVSISGMRVQQDQPILVIGGGPIGLAMIMALRARGARVIIVSEPTTKRREQASVLADMAINPLEESVVEKVMFLTDGKGVKLVFDCAGIQAGIEAGMGAMDNHGIYVNIAAWGKPWNPPQEYVTFKELILKGSMSYNENDFREVVEAFVQGKFKGLENLITRRILLEDVIERGYKELINNKDNHTKILVTPKKSLIIET